MTTPAPVAGANVYYPARAPGSPVVHLARTEARKGAEPALFGICPLTHATELERVQTRRLRRLKWCPRCAEYRDYVKGLGEV